MSELKKTVDDITENAPAKPAPTTEKKPDGKQQQPNPAPGPDEDGGEWTIF